MAKTLIQMADQPLETPKGLDLEQLGTEGVQFFTGGDLYKRYIQERTLMQVKKAREDRESDDATRLKAVSMLLKSTVLQEKVRQELRVVSTLLSSNIDDADKLKYLLEDSSNDTYGVVVFWFPQTHPLYFVTYFIAEEGHCF